MNRHIVAPFCSDNVSKKFTKIIDSNKRIISNTNTFYEIGTRKYIFGITTWSFTFMHSKDFSVPKHSTLQKKLYYGIAKHIFINNVQNYQYIVKTSISTLQPSENKVPYALNIAHHQNIINIYFLSDILKMHNFWENEQKQVNIVYLYVISWHIIL